MQKPSWKLWVGAAAVLLAAGGGGWWWFQGRAPEVTYRTGKMERGALQATVSASGTVNPVTQVSVGTQVSGQIKEMFVDFNSEVKAGQLIAQIDPETFEYRVRQSQADVDSAQAAVLTAQANAAAARAQVSRSQVDYSEAQRDHERKKMLVERQFIAQSEAEKAQALVNTSRESLGAVRAQLAVTEAQIKSAQANVAQRQAALLQAKVDLARTRITSPVDGIVIKRTVEKGQTVAASLQAPELFVIAQNLQDMQVETSIDESDVSRIRLGQKATFTVDAFPGQTFEGQIRQVRKAAQNVANVVTYVAVIGFSNTGGRLLPGMTANVRVVTDTRDNVLKIPNAALRVRIAGVEPAQAPGRPASGPAGSSGTTTGSSGGFSLFSPAYAQPAPGGPGGAGGPGGGLAAMRDRLVAELALTADQQAKLDAIGAELRPRFMELRDLPEDQRRDAREKILADMRGRINAMLNAEQKAKYAQLQAQAPQRGGPAGQPGAAGGPPPSRAAAPAAPARQAPAVAAAPSPAPAAAPAAPAAPGTPAAAAPATGAPAAPAAGSGPLVDFRNRLVRELQLTAPQADKVDAIFADARPKFAQLRELAAEERGKARERIMADIRARITDVLDAPQKVKYQALLAESAGRANTRGRIYLLGEDGKPRAYNVRLGITDGSSTELIVTPNSPDAQVFVEGATVITGVQGPQQAGGSRPAAPAGPRMAF